MVGSFLTIPEGGVRPASGALKGCWLGIPPSPLSILFFKNPHRPEVDWRRESCLAPTACFKRGWQHSRV